MKRRRCRKKKCLFCPKTFDSEPEQKDEQLTCGRARCQAERRRRNTRGWRKKNPEFQATHTLDEQYRRDHRVWKKGYRDEHPEYVAKNRIFVKKSKRKRRLKGKSIVSRKLIFCNHYIRLQFLKVSPPNRARVFEEVYGKNRVNGRAL